MIKSCLNTLSKVNQRSPIHNVYLMGGATYISKVKQSKQKEVFANVVKGKMRNVYTETDTTLQLGF